MAQLLYRLGRFTARHAWQTLVAWLVLLALAVTGFLTLGGTLNSAVTIPGTATAKVTDQLAEDFPDASGGTASVVFHTTDGEAFTAEQRDEIAAVLAEVSEREGVIDAVNPFETESTIADSAQELEDGQVQLDAGREELEAGQAQLDGGYAELDVGQAELDAAREQLEQAGYPEEAFAELDAQQAQLDGAREELDAGQAELDEGLAELDAQQQALDDGAALLELASGVKQVSDSGSAAVGAVMFTEPITEVLPEVKDDVAAVITSAGIDGVEVELSQELMQAIPNIFGIGEAVGVLIAAITLFIMLGTLIGAGLPLINALLGVGVGVAGSLALSGVFEMMSITPVLGVMLGLAVGIDYSLFIIHRHRSQLRHGMNLEHSIGLANGTSGNAVVFAGATVIIALVALNVTGIPFLGMMGTVGAICVAVAILIAITLTPALLSMVGMRILPRKVRTQTAQEELPRVDVKPMGTGRAILSVVIGVALLAVIAIPALDMRLGLPDGSSEPQDSTQYQAFKITEEEFGAGVNGSLLVVADYPEVIADENAIAEQVELGELLLAQENVAAVAPIGVSDSGSVLAFQVIPVDGPTAESTEELVNTLRGLSPVGGEIEIGVAGSASGNIDISQKLADALPGYLVLVVGLSLLILVFVFRSILVPITATLGFVLSLFATFGAITAIFQWGWLGSVFGVHDPGPVLSFLPIIVIGILFGLAMDYQLFLVSGMREAYAHGSNPSVAVQQGFRAGRTVVTAAAIIMISVFAGFIFSNSAMIRSMGFALAFGVLVDAFLVRMLIIPGIMHLLGGSAWWLPKWLDRILPNVDVEGAALERKSENDRNVSAV
ncbi:MAG: MMPL family transporter [Gulosibacter sp.]|uniref:MMPL family transporter n=1 Tax=Gulosibacter sp. TaxID=2817531 RepID=UPI003F91F381